MSIAVDRKETPHVQKCIKTHADIEPWKNSQAYADIISMVTRMGQAVQGKKVSDVAKLPESPVITKLRSVIRSASSLVDEIPPIDQPMRFGNKAFRTFLQRMRSLSVEWFSELIAEIPHGENGPEFSQIRHYFEDCFGNETRVDYGSGHELHFICLLCCLDKLGMFGNGEGAEDEAMMMAQVSLLVFNDYIMLCRKLQTVYMLEPAGSHGVWGLDDYQFIPFYVGAAQLIGHSHIKPKSIHSNDIVVGFSGEYMYLACIKFINEIKTGPFFEHSMYLNDISQVVSWAKINSGLMKMYQAEVLAKFPVVQHLRFGTLLKFDPLEDSEEKANQDVDNKE